MKSVLRFVVFVVKWVLLVRAMKIKCIWHGSSATRIKLAKISKTNYLASNVCSTVYMYMALRVFCVTTVSILLYAPFAYRAEIITRVKYPFCWSDVIYRCKKFRLQDLLTKQSTSTRMWTAAVHTCIHVHVYLYSIHIWRRKIASMLGVPLLALHVHVCSK